MDHASQVKQEFTHQAAHFAAATAIANDDLTQRFTVALGDAGTGDILDVACGPGIITAALAPRARHVTALDLTPEMLAKARQRCDRAALRNVTFHEGSATSLPFAPGKFDAVVTRLSIHHFIDPGKAIERLRDPSHVRMLPATALADLLREAGCDIIAETTWDVPRQFEEWAAIVDNPRRAAPLRTIVRAFAVAGMHAGMGLSLSEDRIVFLHRWHLLVARRTHR